MDLVVPAGFWHLASPPKPAPSFPCVLGCSNTSMTPHLLSATPRGNGNEEPDLSLRALHRETASCLL